ncbi:MAG TPA: DnaJ domain-containing protein [Polyangia bacterium]
MAEPARIAALKRFLEEVHVDLDLFDYYQLLDVARDAAADALRDAFYRRAAELHPDRFPLLDDPAARERLVTIYARIAEGYRVLSDPRKRAVYDAGLVQGQVRLDGAEREKKGPRNPEEAVQNAQAKRFLRLGLQAQQAGDLKGAVMNFKFAKSFEPASEILAELLGKAEAQLKAIPPQAGG